MDLEVGEQQAVLLIGVKTALSILVPAFKSISGRFNEFVISAES